MCEQDSATFTFGLKNFADQMLDACGRVNNKTLPARKDEAQAHSPRKRRRDSVKTCHSMDEEICASQSTLSFEVSRTAEAAVTLSLGVSEGNAQARRSALRAVPPCRRVRAFRGWYGAIPSRRFAHGGLDGTQASFDTVPGRRRAHDRPASQQSLNVAQLSLGALDIAHGTESAASLGSLPWRRFSRYSASVASSLARRASRTPAERRGSQALSVVFPRGARGCLPTGSSAVSARRCATNRRRTVPRPRRSGTVMRWPPNYA